MNNSICLCVFIKKVTTGFAIFAVCVDDLNLIETLEELIKTIDILSRPADQALFKWCINSSINIYRKISKALLTNPLPSDRKSAGNSTVTSQPSSLD